MKQTVDGVEEFLPEEQVSEYGDAFKAACESLAITLEVLNSPGFADRSTWNLDSENEHVRVFYKDIDGKRFFVARTAIPLSCAEGLRMTWEGITSMNEWNDNIRFSRVHAQISEHLDIANYASNKKFMVGSREFIVGRMMRETADGRHIISARSCTVASHKPDPDAVQAYLHLGAGVYTADPTNPSGAIYEYILCMDLKGMLLRSVVNQVMGKLVLSDVENNRLHTQKLFQNRC
ncbi:unnamed protein product [Caenorhabditis auriculariae]|uniref:START domain-containing protein n=1 Tax=Caenorhabditis auriculariae TaxID=2777116 RepID=A0A8S1GNN0_9PELO|nr:unnamed protein product [Caenorhabditis auriculariae]